MAKATECSGFAMFFDVVSFLAGVAAGAVTGVLAAVLRGLESTADLQERLRRVTKEVEKMRSMTSPSSGSGLNESQARSKIEELQRDLEEIHEEIRRMYRKTVR